MTTNVQRGNIYKKCLHLKRTPPIRHSTEEIEKEIASGFDVLPSFESSLFDHIHIQHYSMKHNERLKCSWSAYMENVSGRVFTPFHFPSNRHFHFYNSAIQFLPKETFLKDVRKKLRPGPGIDNFGQMPTPNELFMKRGNIEIKVEDTPKHTVKKEKKPPKNITKGRRRK